ncbi:hypothetical protein AE06_05000 [Klebsiella variicola]|nr:hypothetical protein AE06_05000 [Klebsiella variicola]
MTFNEHTSFAGCDREYHSGKPECGTRYHNGQETPHSKCRDDIDVIVNVMYSPCQAYLIGKHSGNQTGEQRVITNSPYCQYFHPKDSPGHRGAEYGRKSRTHTCHQQDPTGIFLHSKDVRQLIGQGSAHLNRCPFAPYRSAKQM